MPVEPESQSPLGGPTRADPPRRRHRAVVLVAMMVLSLLALAFAIGAGLTGASGGQNGIALLVVLVVSAIAGAAFSWRRYFPGRARPRPRP